MKDSRTVAQRNRDVRRDALLEQLAERCRLQHIIDNIQKLEDLTLNLDANGINRIRSANDQRLKLLNKYLPDMKAVELSGENGAIEITQVVRTIVDPKP